MHKNPVSQAAHLDTSHIKWLPVESRIPRHHCCWRHKLGHVEFQHEAYRHDFSPSSKSMPDAMINRGCEVSNRPLSPSLSKTSQDTGDQDTQCGQADDMVHPANRSRNFRTYFMLKQSSMLISLLHTRTDRVSENSNLNLAPFPWVILVMACEDMSTWFAVSFCSCHVCEVAHLLLPWPQLQQLYSQPLLFPVGVKTCFWIFLYAHHCLI